MNQTLWPAAAPAQAVARVLERLLPGRVATQTASASCDVLVCSYADDFDALWELSEAFLDWLASGDRHIVLVRHSDHRKPDMVRPEDLLTADAWATAVTLAVFDRAPSCSSAWRVSVLDFAPSRGAEHGSAPAFDAQLPHVATVRMPELREWFGNTGSPGSKQPPGPTERVEVERRWRAAHPDGAAEARPLLARLRRCPLAAFASALQRANARYRHGVSHGAGFGTFLVAVRLLLGAMQAGTVSPDQGRELLRQIRARQPDAPLETAYDFALLRRYLDTLQRVGELPTGSAASGPAQRSRKLLLIDDDHATAGWDVVLPALFPAWQVEVGPPDLLDKRLASRGGLADLQLVLLDYNLGVGETRSGLDLLDRIREVHPFLPTILFTREDDPALVTSSIDRGASAFFAKELSNTTDRDSLAYFTALHDLIETYGATDPADLQQMWTLWRRVDVVARTIAWDAPSLGHRASLAAQAVTSIERAILWCACALQRPLDVRVQLHRATGVALSQCIDALDKLVQSNGGKAGGADAARAFSKESRHGSSVADRSTADVLACCVELVPLLESTVTTVTSARKPGVAGATVAPHEVKPPGVRARFGTHRQRSIFGAVRFVLGHYLHLGAVPNSDDVAEFGLEIADAPEVASGLETVLRAIRKFGGRIPDTEPRTIADPRHVLLIDDTADIDGWVLALRTGAPDVVIRHLRYTGTADAERAHDLAASSDIILLDLCLPAADGVAPDERTGRDLLCSLRRGASTPVIVVSANDDILSTRRSLDAGAVGYFAKSWTPLPQQGDSLSREFYESYYTALRSQLDIDAPTAKLLLLASEAAPLTRVDRYRASTDLDLAARIDAVVNLVRTLAWVPRDPAHRWLHSRIVDRPIAWRDQEASFAEVTVCLTALVENMLRRICERDPETSGRDHALTMLGEAIELTRDLFTSDVTAKLSQLATIRNRAVHKTAAQTLDVDLGEVLRAVANVIAVVTTKLVEYDLPGRSTGVSGALRDAIAKTYGRSGPRKVSDASSDYLFRKGQSADRWKAAERRCSAASETAKRSMAERDATTGMVAALRAELDDRLIAAAGDPRATKRVQDSLGPKIADAETRLATVELEHLEHALAAEAARLAADEARRAHWDHLEALPPPPAISARRWAVAMTWIEERSVEERIAAKRNECPRPCHWSSEPLSEHLDTLVNTLVAGGHDHGSVWDAVRTWIEDGTSNVAQARNHDTRGSSESAESDTER